MTIYCPACHSARVIKNGTRGGRQQYVCRDCGRQFLRDMPETLDTSVIRVDKKIGEFDWRQWSDHLVERQELTHAASWSQESAHVEIPHHSNVVVLKGLADSHIGSLGVDYGSLVDFTDNVVGIPYLYTFLLGDEEDNFASFKSALAVLQQILTPEQQDEFVESWLGEISHKILFGTWGNHGEFEEKSTGRNTLRQILSRNVSYFNGIGVCSVKFGDQEYKIVATHKTRYNSSFNKTHGLKQLARREIPDADVYVAGHTHDPSFEVCFERGMEQAYIVLGSLKRGDTYARRYFSYFASQHDAAVTIDSRRHELMVWATLEQALRYAEVENAGSEATA